MRLRTVDPPYVEGKVSALPAGNNMHLISFLGEDLDGVLVNEPAMVLNQIKAYSDSLFPWLKLQNYICVFQASLRSSVFAHSFLTFAII